MSSQTPTPTLNRTAHTSGKPLALHLVGLNVSHSVGAVMHNHIARSLSLPWTFHNTECRLISEVALRITAAETVAVVVTMPWKTVVLEWLEELAETGRGEVSRRAKEMGAVNCVFHVGGDGDEDGALGGGRRIYGTNTDWAGIKGALVAASSSSSQSTTLGSGSNAMHDDRTGTAVVVGAGGAARAAIYALYRELGCSTIFVVNRDVREVEGLMEGCKSYGEGLTVVHVRKPEEVTATQREGVKYVVVTIPDFAVETEDERVAETVVKAFLDREEAGRGEDEKGVLLDLCYEPRRTRHIRLGEKYGWKTVEGTEVVGHQMREQWKHWVGEEKLEEIDWEGGWRELRMAADETPELNT
ncbi:NAD(P)-binding protein [Aulographum hederae CBS 113979]|uniref:NAD(P)-binding protein n=1 Tax=Aulographum hederae CBS 113979 TaxID=1176131 RepID=A0A6G1H1X7_9PEZI|nr:NAD(P)-binding protein [Aulographum hederae CBS 113979]